MYEDVVCNTNNTHRVESCIGAESLYAMEAKWYWYKLDCYKVRMLVVIPMVNTLEINKKHKKGNKEWIKLVHYKRNQTQKKAATEESWKKKAEHRKQTAKQQKQVLPCS